MARTAILGSIVTTAYVVATVATFSDGIGVGLEIPHAINSMCIAAVCCTTTISGCAWFARQGHMRAAEVHIRPVVRQELDKAFTDHMPLFAATVAEAAQRRVDTITERFDAQIQAIALLAAKQTAARIREAHTADLTEICQDLHRKTVIAGMQLQANATGEEIGKSALRSVKTYVSTSMGD